MAKYTAPTGVRKIKFEDHPGLIVHARSIPLGELMRITELVDQGLGDVGAFREALGMFAKALLGWNLVDDDDADIPATLEGLIGLDAGFSLELMEGWMTSIAGVSAPLAEKSPSGEMPPLMEAGLPMGNV